MICSQDQLYVQNVELARFSAQFRDVATKFAENEKTIRSLQVMGSNLYEVSWRFWLGCCWPQEATCLSPSSLVLL